MKKFVSGLVVILIFGSSLFAKEPKKPQLYVGTGNDKFTYGISRNDDDQLTYSGIVDFVYDNYEICIDLEAYTDRGSWVNEEFRKGRLDGIFLYTTYKNIIDVNRFLYVDVDKTAGLGLTGKFSFDFIQNIHHKNVGVDPVYIPYDEEYIKAAPIFGLTAGLNLKLGNLQYRIAADYLNTIFFASSKKASATVSFLDLLSFELGYKLGKNFSTFRTMDSVIESQSGIFMNINFKSSPVKIRWEYYPQTSFGYGSFSVDALSLFRNPTWKHSEVFIDESVSSLYEMELLSTVVRVPFNDKLSFSLGVGYVSGFPVATVSDTRIQRNYALYETGVHYVPIQWFVSPYLQASIGCGYFQLNYLNNTIEEKVENQSLPAKFAITSDLRCGFEILPEGILSFGNTSYKAQLFGGVHIIPWSNGIASVLENDHCHPQGWKPRMISPYFGIGLSIGVDIPE